VTSGELIAISGSAGCVISFVVAGLIVIAVMRTLAEMVSVRALSGALIDFAHTFVDPALGFAVGITYWSVLASWVEIGTQV
jgi:yeast amino acid transporter